MNEDVMFERQKELLPSLPKAVAVVGCGGVGSWVAYLLALAGVKEIWLFDHDTVSENNLNRLPVPPDCLGMLKSEAMKKTIEALRPNCSVLAMRGFSPELANQLEMHKYVKWVIATTDSLSSRRMVHQWKETWKYFVNYIEAAAEGEFGSATGMPAEWSTPDEDNPGYASVPVWVGPCISAAMLAATHVLHGCKLGDNTIRLGYDAGPRKFTVQLHDQATEDSAETAEEDEE